MKDFRVADIISPFKLILNCGVEAGIQMGNQFLIFGLTKPIIDPDTGEELEQAEIIRGRGKVTHLQKKICTIESIEIEKGNKTIRKSQGLGGMFLGTTEEIIGAPNILPFDNSLVGDYARLLTQKN